MAYTGTSINTSPTIALAAGEAITAGGGKFVKVENGAVKACAADDDAFGVLILQTNDEVNAGDSVTVQISHRALVVAGGAFKAGEYISVGAEGKAVKAAADKKIVGMALADAATKDVVEVLLLHGGSVPAASV